MTMKKQKTLFYGVLVAALAAFSPARAADYGAVGSPIHLTAGHPCCYAASWSAYIVHEKEFWKKYLPQGSTVDFEIGLAGPPVVNNLLAGKVQIGYLGDIPAIAAVTKEKMADVRLVATTAVSYDQCGIMLERMDAPKFDDSKKAVEWLDGKQFAVTRGSCGDRFAKIALKGSNATPASYLNQTIEVISTSFRAGKIDGAVVWEPVASHLVNEKLAKRVASGVTYNIEDGAFIAMRGDLIDARPDVAEAWLKAELDAQLFMADPKNADEVVAIIGKYVSQFSKKDLKDAIYGRYTADEGGSDVRMIQPFTFTPDVRKLLSDATAFLYDAKGVSSPTLNENVIDSKMADKVLAERGLTAPIGKLVATQ